MKKIEERAQAYTDKVGILGAYNGYIAGATEQKVIDDKECESLVGLTAKEVKQVMIDKACEFLNERLYPAVEVLYEDLVDVIDRRELIDEFRKAMTEKED